MRDKISEIVSIPDRFVKPDVLDLSNLRNGSMTILYEAIASVSSAICLILPAASSVHLHQLPNAMAHSEHHLTVHFSMVAQ